MGFFQTIPRSIYSPSFFAAAPRTSLGSALGFFFLLIALLTIVKTAILVVPGLTRLTPAAHQFLQGMMDAYPGDLVINIRNGRVSTNAPEPYIIPLEGENDSSESTIRNLIVIDTTQPFSVEQFARYQTIVWLTSDSIVIAGQASGQIQTYPLTQVSSYTLDRNTVNGWLSALDPFVGLIAPIVGVFALLGIYLVYMLRLVYLFVLALVIWGMFRMLRVNRSYGESYRYGIYAMTAALIVDLLLNILMPYLHFSGFPFMFSAITLLVVAINALAWRGERENYVAG